MRDAALWIVIVGLGWVVVFHLYWAAGGRVGADAVIPRRPAAKGGEALFHPSPLGTLIVALFLLGVIALGVAAQRGVDITLPWSWIRTLLGVCGAIFVLRAIGEFRYLGFFKRVKDSRFAYWDTRLFSPFVLVIGAACLIIAVRAEPRAAHLQFGVQPVAEAAASMAQPKAPPSLLCGPIQKYQDPP